MPDQAEEQRESGEAAVLPGGHRAGKGGTWENRWEGMGLLGWAWKAEVGLKGEGVINHTTVCYRLYIDECISPKTSI